MCIRDRRLPVRPQPGDPDPDRPHRPHPAAAARPAPGLGAPCCVGAGRLVAKRTPDGPPPEPVVARIRLRYARRGRLRFTSHRDFARAFERALRRAGVPMALSAGFSPHPRISYVGAAPTGMASEAEYVEIALTERLDAETVRAAVDASLPPGLDVVDAVVARGGSLPDRICHTEASIRSGS